MKILMLDSLLKYNPNPVSSERTTQSLNTVAVWRL